MERYEILNGTDIKRDYGSVDIDIHNTLKLVSELQLWENFWI